MLKIYDIWYMMIYDDILNNVNDSLWKLFFAGKSKQNVLMRTFALLKVVGDQIHSPRGLQCGVVVISIKANMYINLHLKSHLIIFPLNWKLKVVCLWFEQDLVFQASFAAATHPLESFHLIFVTNLSLYSFWGNFIRQCWWSPMREQIINCHFYSNPSNQSQY